VGRARWGFNSSRGHPPYMSKLKIRHHIKEAVATPEYTKILILRTIGNFLIITSVFMIIKTFYLPLKEEFRFTLEKYTGKKYVVEDKNSKSEIRNSNLPPKGGLASLLNIKPVEVLRPEDPNFSVVVPKIGANARIIPHVDASNEDAYLAALKKGVAHVEGTAYPGEGGHIFLFAHSTDYIWNVGSYNAVFYLLYKLEKGDEINLYYKGQRYVYIVVEKKVVDPSQVEYLTRKTNKEFLTLQTCWPPGTTLKRLLVFATRASD